MDSVVAVSVVSSCIGFATGWLVCRMFPRHLKPLSPVSVIPARGRMKLVLVVRDDLNMTKGKVAAQCSHATIACYLDALEVDKSIVSAWESQGQPKIVLKAKSEDELNALSKKCDELNLVNNIVHDAGHTQVPEGSATVLGIGPGVSSLIDQVSGTLKLY